MTMTPDPFAVAFFDLFDLNGLLAFIGGVLATFLWCWAQDRYHDKTNPENKPHRTKFRSLLLLWMMVYVVVGYIAIKQQSQSIAIHRMANDTKACQAEFLKQLKIRSEASDQAEEWSRRKTKAIGDWMHELTFPPPDMAERRRLDPRDPVYQRWALDITDKYFQQINAAEVEQAAAIAERKKHPLPEPTCGR